MLATVNAFCALSSAYEDNIIQSRIITDVHGNAIKTVVLYGGINGGIEQNSIQRNHYKLIT